MAQIETSRVRLKYLGKGFLALVFMIGTLAGRFSRAAGVRRPAFLHRIIRAVRSETL